VNNYNTNVVGTVNAQGSKIASSIILPKNYALGERTISQDFRLNKAFTFKEKYKFNIFGEMFNAFNISNLVIGTLALDTSASASSVCQQGSVAPGAAGSISCQFGQATARQGQTFGSAGPRALQIGARFTF